MEYKGYVIEGDKTFGMMVIKFPGQGGQVPDILKGTFTKPKEAMRAIDQYVLLKEERDNRPPAIKKVKLTPREVSKDDTEGESRG